MSSEEHDSLLGEDSFPVGRLGAQYERTFRILTYLLAAWCDNAENREQDDKRTFSKKDVKGLSIIAFDKLAVFSYRIWNQLWSLKVEEKDRKRMVSFPYPFREIPGKHGRGIGLYNWHPINKRPGFLPEILIKMAKDGTQKYLRFENIEIKHMNADELHENIFHRILVTPGLEVASLDYLLKGMNEYENSILRDLQNAIKRLNNHEVRVLGTHSQQGKTIQDIRILLNKWRKFRKNILNNELAEIGKILNNLEEMAWHAEEMWRKVDDNRQVYKKACNKIYNEFSHSDLKKAFQFTQSKEKEIWDCKEMNSLRDIAMKAKKVSDFALKEFKKNDQLTKDIYSEIKKVIDL